MSKQVLPESPAWAVRLEDADKLASRQYLRVGVLIAAFLGGLFGVIFFSQLTRRRISRTDPKRKLDA